MNLIFSVNDTDVTISYDNRNFVPRIGDRVNIYVDGVATSCRVVDVEYLPDWENVYIYVDIID